jgi:5-methyltetrahydrofolate--homocysteine methyltransferase
VHVPDASRAAEVVGRLLDPVERPAFADAIRAEQQTARDRHHAREPRQLISYADALARRVRFDWPRADIASPAFTGRRVLDDVPIAELVPFIDWTFFFAAWELKGRSPAILDHPDYGAAARELYGHARQLLGRLAGERLVRARAVYGFWPANSDGDDIVVFEPRDEAGRGRRELVRFRMLRQQEISGADRSARSLADFVAPVDSGRLDFVGAFAVTAGVGVDELVRRFERDRDDYQAIMVKALADRLAEALSEYLHARARREWGYGRDERLSPEDLIAERYRGIRPAFGYPACPDHSEKVPLFSLLDAGAIGLTLTESGAMMPAASVSGLYLGHPEARYFSVGRIGGDQVAAYAARKGEPVEAVERWLGPNLAYEPSSVP